jgi:hypothetical protein
MKSILLSVLGLIIGAMMNLLVISLGSSLLSDNHYAIAIIAHMVGAFTGAFFVCMVRVDRPKLYAISIGGAYLGMAVMDMLVLKNLPLWFILTDVFLAHLPLAYLGYRLGAVSFTQSGPAEK